MLRGRRRYLWPALAALLGGGLGFGYYFFVGCATGHCPITSDPYIATGFGVLIGGMAAWPGKPPQDR